MGGDLRVENAKAPAGRGFGEAKKNRFRGNQLFQKIGFGWPEHCVWIFSLIWNITQFLTILSEDKLMAFEHRIVWHCSIITRRQVLIPCLTDHFPLDNRMQFSRYK
ncbi:hypothetical protein ASE33_09925 [Pseudomonas sp. Root9]|nr:hypothetical protein ASE33_09925 [Pseudomonas sp. Root9]